MTHVVHEYRYKIKGQWLSQYHANNQGIIEWVKATGDFVKMGDYLVLPMPFNQRGIYQIINMQLDYEPLLLWHADVKFISIPDERDTVEEFQNYVETLV